MKTKIIIEIEGGNIKEVIASNEIEVVIIDHDLKKIGEETVTDFGECTVTDGKLSNLFTGTKEIAIKKKLQDFNF